MALTTQLIGNLIEVYVTIFAELNRHYPFSKVIRTIILTIVTISGVNQFTGKMACLFLPPFGAIRTLHRVSYYIHRNGTDLFAPYSIKRKCEQIVMLFMVKSNWQLTMWFSLPFSLILIEYPELWFHFNYFLILP